MDEYRKGYFILWQAITAALAELQEYNIGNAATLLRQGQNAAEEAYISSGANDDDS